MMQSIPIQALQLCFSVFKIDSTNLITVKQLVEFEEYDFQKFYDDVKESAERIKVFLPFLNEFDSYSFLFGIRKLYSNRQMAKAVLDYQNYEYSEVTEGLLKMIFGDVNIVRWESPGLECDLIDLGDERTPMLTITAMSPNMLSSVLSRLLRRHGELMMDILPFYLSFGGPQGDELVIRRFIAELARYHSRLPLAPKTDSAEERSLLTICFDLCYNSVKDKPQDEFRQPMEGAMTNVDLLKRTIACLKNIPSESRSVSYWMLLCNFIIICKDQTAIIDEIFWLIHNIPVNKVVPIVLREFIETFYERLLVKRTFLIKKFPELSLPILMKSFETRLKLYFRKGPFSKFARLDHVAVAYEPNVINDILMLIRRIRRLPLNCLVNTSTCDDSPVLSENAGPRFLDELLIDQARDILANKKASLRDLDEISIDRCSWKILLTSWPYLILYRHKLPFGVLFGQKEGSWEDLIGFASRATAHPSTISNRDCRTTIQDYLEITQVRKYFSIIELRGLIDSDFNPSKV